MLSSRGRMLGEFLRMILHSLEILPSLSTAQGFLIGWLRYASRLWDPLHWSVMSSCVSLDPTPFVSATITACCVNHCIDAAFSFLFFSPKKIHYLTLLCQCIGVFPFWYVYKGSFSLICIEPLVVYLYDVLTTLTCQIFIKKFCWGYGVQKAVACQCV